MNYRNEILKLPNRRNIITKYGKFQDIHKSCKLDIFDLEFYRYIYNNYKDFKTYK